MSGDATNGDAVDIVDNEGIGYAVLHYCSGDHFKDPMTVDLWNAAGSQLKALQAYLEKETGREL